MTYQSHRIPFCIAASGEIENRLTSGNDKKKYDDEITEKFLERVLPQTEADRKLQLKLQRLAHLRQRMVSDSF